MANSVSLGAFPITVIIILLIMVMIPTSFAAAAPGSWQVLQKSIGVSAMHMQLLKNDRVIIFDRTNFGRSQLNLTNGKCRDTDIMVNPDCTAHSVEYDAKANTFRPLMILTDTWCSSGAVTPDGSLFQTGGWRDGEREVRVMQPCSTSSCDWNELGNKLSKPRWYASNHILPNGQIAIVGGIGQYNYEFYPKTTPDTQGPKELPFLLQTLGSGGSDDNLYPFVFLTPDDNLFIFANNRSILLNYKTNTVIKNYPTIPGGQPRNYPSTGSAVLLPLKDIDSNAVQAELFVCGGAPKGSLNQAHNGNFLTALNDCGRLRFTDPDPQWTMESMPMPRVMGDMLLLPNGHVILINGCERGVAGWELCRDDIRTPVIYRPDEIPKNRFEVQAPSSIPRVYHSTAVVLRDGRVMAGGSNTHFGYEFGQNVLYPTELSLDAFSPWYIGSNLRPKIIDPAKIQIVVKYSQILSITFSITEGAPVDLTTVKVTILSPPYNTHSFSQGQRMLELTRVGKPVVLSTSTYRVTVTTPNSEILAPPVYYMMFVVHKDAPSTGKWLKISR